MRCLFFRIGWLVLLQINAAMAAPHPRVVALGGPVTETVYALGKEALLVGTDSSSVYPEAATKLPQVGYQRTLAAEGIVSLAPELILATDEAGPPAVIEQLRSSGVKIVLVPSEHSVPGAQAKVRAIAAALGCADRGEQLAAVIGKEAEEARTLLQPWPTQPKVLFLYARGGATMNVSGAGTAADAMIALAGGRNAATGYEGYKPLTTEGGVAAAPEVILLTSRGLESAGGTDKLLTQPGLSFTPAARSKRVVALDDLYLLGFGPRTGAAIRDLARALHPDAPRP